MFFARPISLKTEVWDRIDTYLNEYASSHPGFMPNRSAFLEEAAVAFLDAKEAEAGGGSSATESADELSLDDLGTEELLAEEAAGDESGEVEEVVEVDLVLIEEPDEAEEEEVEEEAAPKPARKSAKKAAKKAVKKSAKKSSKKSAQKSRRK